MQTETKMFQLAGEAYVAFTTTERGEDTIVVLKDDAPQWVHDLVRKAHGSDFLPDDWRFAAIRSALGAIYDDEPSDLDEHASEWADNHVDIYTHARLQWLASSLDRMSYCDDAREEGLVSEDADIAQRVGVGQYMEAQEVYGYVAQGLQDRADELEDEG